VKGSLRKKCLVCWREQIKKSDLIFGVVNGQGFGGVQGGRIWEETEVQDCKGTERVIEGEVIERNRDS
jgi:hypothetical protein